MQAEIANASATAQIALQGAQVLTFQLQGSAPVLFLSPHAFYAPGKAGRGGIPICWPWFGPHPTDPTKPQHGFVRTVPWGVRRTGGLDACTTEVRLGLDATPATRALWPHPFALTLTVQVGRALRVLLATHNPGQQPLRLTEALHSYCHIGSLAGLTVQGLEGTVYRDKVAGGSARCRPAPSPSATKRTGYICRPLMPVVVEVGNALDDTVTVAPGATHELAMVIEVAPLGGSGPAVGAGPDPA